jgi:hypothetical protein
MTGRMEARLAERGLTLPPARKPLFSYQPVVIAKDFASGLPRGVIEPVRQVGRGSCSGIRREIYSDSSGKTLRV